MTGRQGDRSGWPSGSVCRFFSQNHVPQPLQRTPIRWDIITPGNQRILDAARAKWGTAKNMRPHYDNYIHACVTAGIGYLNLLFSADDLDADGVPNQPEMMYHDGEKWRVVSIDEVKGEDTTHGSGGDRKGRCERTCRAGADDDGE